MQEACGQNVVRKFLSITNKCENYKTLFLNSECYTFAQIMDVISGFGYQMQPIQSELLDIKKEELPAISQVVIDEKSHFVLVTKITKSKVSFYDPNIGDITVKRTYFESITTFRFLVLVSSPKRKKKMSLPMIIRKRNILTIGLFSLIESALSLGVLSFIDNNKNSLYLGIFFAGLIFTVIFHIIYNFSINKSVDKRIIFKYFNQKGDANGFKEALKLKSNVLFKVNTFFVSLSTLICFLFLSATKDMFQFCASLFFILILLSINALCANKNKFYTYKSLLLERKMLDKVQEKDSSYISEYSSALKNSTYQVIFKNLGLIITSLCVFTFLTVTNLLTEDSNLTSFMFFGSYHLLILLSTQKLYQVATSVSEYRKTLLTFDCEFVETIKLK